MSHTPGPWECIDRIIMGPPGHGEIACVFGRVLHGEEEANTALLCAAPAMLKALRQIAAIGGNLSDAAHTGRTGPNDAHYRGLMYCQAREIAHAAIKTAGLECGCLYCRTHALEETRDA